MGVWIAIGLVIVLICLSIGYVFYAIGKECSEDEKMEADNYGKR